MTFKLDNKKNETKQREFNKIQSYMKMLACILSSFFLLLHIVTKWKKKINGSKIRIRQKKKVFFILNLYVHIKIQSVFKCVCVYKVFMHLIMLR